MATATIDKRICSASLRAITTGGKPVIRGYAAIFNSLSLDLGGFRERLLPGAFTAALRNCNCVALVDHNSSMVLGRTTAGTLILTEDSYGLAVEIHPPDTTVGRDLLVSMQRGDITSMSFAFLVGPGGDRWTKENGETIREILPNGIAELFDTSCVTYPAYPAASCEVSERTQQAYQQHRSSGTADACYKARTRMIDLMVKAYPTRR